MSERERETYLGDGLYVSFDGWQFKLRAPREEGDHMVFLEPEVFFAFRRFVEETWKELNKAEEANDASTQGR